jgi:hypothetical protein
MVTQNCEILEISLKFTKRFYLYKDINIKFLVRKIICDDVSLIEPNQNRIQFFVFVFTVMNFPFI